MSAASGSDIDSSIPIPYIKYIDNLNEIKGKIVAHMKPDNIIEYFYYKLEDGVRTLKDIYYIDTSDNTILLQRLTDEDKKLKISKCVDISNPSVINNLVNAINSLEKCLGFASRTISKEDPIDRLYRIVMTINKDKLVPDEVMKYVEGLREKAKAGAGAPANTSMRSKLWSYLGYGGKRTRRHHHQTKRHRAKRPQSTRRKNNK